MQHIQKYWEAIKESIRHLIGPSPNVKYLVFENEEVIAEGLEHCKYSPIAMYKPKENCILSTNAVTESPKRLPWISIQHIIGDHVVDLSDWISDVRSNISLSLLTVLRLASKALNQHLPESDHAKIQVITRSGDEETYVFNCKTKLTKPSIQRRLTCPYDD